MCALVSILFTAAFAAAGPRGEPLRSSVLLEFLELAETVSLPDAELAQRLAAVRLFEKIPAKEISRWGERPFGPATRAQLQRLEQESAAGKFSAGAPATEPKSLRRVAAGKLPPVPAWEADLVLSEVKSYALSYAASIPNFTCIRHTEIQSSKDGMGIWTRERDLDERISLENGIDRRQTIRTKNRRRFWQRSSVLHVSGEFGVLLGRIFSEKSHTGFAWVGVLPAGLWLLSYRVPQEHSSLTLSANGRSAVAGYRGYLEVDPAGGAIHSMSYQTDGLPPDFPHSGGEGTVIYGKVKIENEEHLLPVEASMVAFVNGSFVQNRARYSTYSKFDTSSEIRYDPEPLDPGRENLAP